jgi:DNA-binding transcriptional regulator YdaS (Cro superfamily)
MTPHQAIEHFGTQVKLAQALDIRQGSVSEWVIAGKVPWLRQLHIEKVTKGKLKADAITTKDAA